jgi:hypothetical protein
MPCLSLALHMAACRTVSAYGRISTAGLWYQIGCHPYCKVKQQSFDGTVQGFIRLKTAIENSHRWLYGTLIHWLTSCLPAAKLDKKGSTENITFMHCYLGPNCVTYEVWFHSQTVFGSGLTYASSDYSSTLAIAIRTLRQMMEYLFQLGSIIWQRTST